METIKIKVNRFLSINVSNQSSVISWQIDINIVSKNKFI